VIVAVCTNVFIKKSHPLVSEGMGIYLAILISIPHPSTLEISFISGKKRMESKENSRK